MNNSGWRRHLWFLASRKVQAALATIIAAVCVQYGHEMNETTIQAIIAVGVAIILGIAIEDHGRNSAA